MGFVCPKCNERKDGHKKNSTTCLDCYTNAQVEDKLRSVLEKLEKRELDVQKREEMVSEVEVALLKKHAEIMTHEASLQRMESDLRARETVILLKEAKLEKKPNRLKRGAEEEAVGQRNRKMFCDLKERRKYQVVSDTVKAVTNLGRGNAVDLLRAVNKRVFGETGEEQVNFVWTLLRNIAEFSAHYLPHLTDKSRMAAVLTQGLALRDAHELTHVPLSSIAWGRKEVDEKRFVQTEVRTYSSFHFNIA